jgi:hypothetical protein
MNRLEGSMSPYLQQHAQNPVHWWPWCEDAFAEARRRDVPDPAERRVLRLFLVPRDEGLPKNGTLCSEAPE